MEDSSKHSTGSNDKGFEKLFSDFAELFSIKDTLRRDYELYRKSKRYNEEFGLAPERYQKLFKNYCQLQEAPDWLDSVQKVLKSIVSTLQGLAFVTVFFGILQFIWSLQDREVNSISKSWEIITAAAGKQQVGAGRKRAIEYLYDRGEDLSNLSVPGVVLTGLNLPPKGEEVAQLQDADFRGAKLVGAYLKKSNLYNANFSTLIGFPINNSFQGKQVVTELGWANLEGANLRYANFQGTGLKYACLRRANLEGAKFDEKTDLTGVAFDQAIGLEQATMQNRGKLIPLSQWLQSHPNSNIGISEGHGCLVSPKAKRFWRMFGQ